MGSYCLQYRLSNYIRRRDVVTGGKRIFQKKTSMLLSVEILHLMRNAGKGSLWVDFHIFSF